MTSCPECRGSGVRAGHATSPYDVAEFECFDCGGEGEWEDEPVCIGCDQPFVDGYCAACWEQLTEVHGDPFLKARAA